MSEQASVEVTADGRLLGPIPRPRPGESIAGAWLRQRMEARGAHCSRRATGCRPTKRCGCVCEGCRQEAA
jgi:hypothetical protein